MADLQLSIEAIQNAETSEKAFEEFCKGIRGYGYENAVFSLMTDHNSIGLKALHGHSTNYPEDWMTHYRENGLHAVDPVFQRILLKPGVFDWSQAVPQLESDARFDARLLEQSRNLMNEASDAGLSSGIAVSIANEWGEIAGIGVSRSDNEVAGDVRILAEIFLISAVLHEKYISGFKAWSPDRLTTREKEVLSWSAEGKSDWETAQIIGISRSTIRFHWNNIFRKLGVNNKITATVHAVRRRIIFPDTITPGNLK
ncbi:LuxR family transcriptional regulator [Roseibium aggregatum]|uniref:Transcriptional activator protein LasR n=1 Tax=Roseibium aggregatum TaxID=187304 RepID=A0A0M6YF09_9HYPH|nr:LuxR family transcriptional regulator [Roseibium aggregatum]CTQ47601.1 Transcriptional activator protein LasR [Roseibium aggregatum]